MHRDFSIPRACLLACFIAIRASLFMVIAHEGAFNDGITASNVTNATIQGKNVSSCDNAETRLCAWGTSRIQDTACCPKQYGEACHPSISELCSAEFGLICLDVNTYLQTDGPGICRGLYNLTAIDVGTTRVTLQFEHFAPPGYDNEYVVLFREDSFNHDITRWTISSCGAKTECVKHRLTPDTIYLFKMSVWSNMRTMKLGDTTETIVVTTKGIDYCVWHDGQVEVGQNFIHSEEDNCTCLSTGEIHCLPLCPNGAPKVQPGCRAVLHTDCIYNITCYLEEGFEEVDDEICDRYSEGSELHFDCKICSCIKGKLACSYSAVCNKVSPKPACKHVREINIPGQCCPEWECMDVCEFEKESYSAGELFTSETCGICQCQPTGRVECVSKCPPVEMVEPSTACPFPHIKLSGCCDTLHCFKSESDLFSYVPNLVALYTTAVTLTLSFEVQQTCEVQGHPDYCNYRIQYTNTSSPQESTNWKNRVVHPIDVIHDEMSISIHPLELVTRDTSVVINGRAVITLTGMHPRTEFYVVVTREEVEEFREDMIDMEETITGSLGENSLAARVVVKTRPLKNVTSCFYSGQEVLHGAIVSKSCNQLCSCQLGQIVCQSTCEDEGVIVAASLTCPRPRLEKRNGKCCPEWHCHPTVSGCYYKKTLLTSGQIVNDGCQQCICQNSAVHCKSLCPNMNAQPQPGCVLTNRTNHCCPQWTCPIEKSSPTAVESSIVLKLQGSCQHPLSEFKKKISLRVLNHVAQLAICSNQSESFNFCSELGVRVECNNDISTLDVRPKRSIEDSYIRVIIYVRQNISISVKEPEIVSSFTHALQKLLNTSFSIQLTEGHIYHSYDNVQLNRVEYICRHGFTYKNGLCVLSQIDIIGSDHLKVTLVAVNISQTSVKLQWSALETSLEKQILSLHINYKKFGTVDWMSTDQVPPTITNMPLYNLHPGTHYQADLVAFTFDQKNYQQKWMLANISFTTFPTSDISSVSHSITLQLVSVTSDTIILYWGHWTQEFQSQVKMSCIHYQISNSNITQIHMVTLSDLPFTQINGLSSSTNYAVWMQVDLSSGKSLFSSSLKISSQPLEKCGHSFLLPVLIACIALFCLVLILLLVLLLRRGQRQTTNGFFNKMFGVDLSDSERNSNSTNNSSAS